MVSATEGNGLAAAWDEMQALAAWRRRESHWARARAEQARYWFEQEVRQALLAQLDPAPVRARMDALAGRVAQGELAPAAAARQLVASLK